MIEIFKKLSKKKIIVLLSVIINTYFFSNTVLSLISSTEWIFQLIKISLFILSSGLLIEIVAFHHKKTLSLSDISKLFILFVIIMVCANLDNWLIPHIINPSSPLIHLLLGIYFLIMVVISLINLFTLLNAGQKGVALLIFIIYTVLIISFFAVLYTHFGLSYQDSETKDLYNALYFSIVSFTTVGYGDFQPSEPIRIWASIESLFGIISLGLMVHILTIMGKANKKIYIIHRANQRRSRNKKF